MIPTLQRLAARTSFALRILGAIYSFVGFLFRTHLGLAEFRQFVMVDAQHSFAAEPTRFRARVTLRGVVFWRVAASPGLG